MSDTQNDTMITLLGLTVGKLETNYRAHIKAIEEQRRQLLVDLEAAIAAVESVFAPVEAKTLLAMPQEERDKRIVTALADMPFRLLDVGRVALTLLAGEGEQAVARTARRVVTHVYRDFFTRKFKTERAAIDLYFAHAQAEGAASVEVSPEAADTIDDLIDNPPPPTQPLVDAFRMHAKPTESRDN